MGLRGPPPLPAAEKKARGTFQKGYDRAAGLVETAPGCPLMPKGLPTAARKRWAEVTPELLRMGLLAVVDGGALEAYCRAWAVFLKLMVKPDKDQVRAARSLHKDVIQPLEAALGLHYAARSRMRKPDNGAEVDPVAEEFFGPMKVVEGGKG